MKEELISFETAKLAKNIGFNILQSNCYDPECLDINHSYNWHNEIKCSTQERIDRLIPCPSQASLQKYIRKKHKINIVIGWLDNVYGFYYQITTMSDNIESDISNGYLVYENALEDALLESLKLINKER